MLEKNEHRPSFLREYKQTELDAFQEMMEKMIQSKNYEIYQCMIQEKKDRLEGVGDIKEATVSSEGEPEPFMEDVEEEEGSHLDS